MFRTVVANMIAVGEVVFKDKRYCVKPLSLHNEVEKQPGMDSDGADSCKTASGTESFLLDNMCRNSGLGDDHKLF